MSAVSAVIRLRVLPPVAPDMVARAENLPPMSPPPVPSIPTRDLDAEALEELAFQWLESFFAKAGKRNPFCRLAKPEPERDE